MPRPMECSTDKNINTKAGTATASSTLLQLWRTHAFLSCCYFLELRVYGAQSLQSHLKHQLHLLACKQVCACKSCLMVAQGLGLQSMHRKHKVGHWKHWSVCEHGGRDGTTHAETTPTGNHFCDALEKLIRLLILVATWVRWSHKGMHLLRIKTEEWQRAQAALQKPPRAGSFTQPEGSSRGACEREDRVTDEGALFLWNPWHEPLCCLLKRHGCYWSSVVGTDKFLVS